MKGPFDLPRTIAAGESFACGGEVTFTVLADVTLEDNEGNAIGSYTVGDTYQGRLPKSTYVVSAGLLKLWEA